MCIEKKTAIYSVMQWVRNVGICTSNSALLNLLCGAGNFGQIWSACGQHEIQYTK
jgi:hypothetical protein